MSASVQDFEQLQGLRIALFEKFTSKSTSLSTPQEHLCSDEMRYALRELWYKLQRGRNQHAYTKTTLVYVINGISFCVQNIFYTERITVTVFYMI